MKKIEKREKERMNNKKEEKTADKENTIFFSLAQGYLH